MRLKHIILIVNLLLYFNCYIIGGADRVARWSKLQKQIYLLIDKNINLQIHCSVIRMKSQRGSAGLPRYFITLDKDVIFDYPKQFINKKLPDEMAIYSLIENVAPNVQELYPYITEISDISELFREYIDTPLDDLYEKEFISDEWGLTDILKSADRRIGLSKLKGFISKTQNDATQKIIASRQIKHELQQDIKIVKI